MRNILRYASIVVCSGIMGYMVIGQFSSKYNFNLSLWLFFTYFSILLNQFIVNIFTKYNSSRPFLMLISYSLVAISTVSCIVGSIYFFYVSPIVYNEKPILAISIILQVSCLHSMFSSAEFIIKQREMSLDDEELI